MDPIASFSELDRVEGRHVVVSTFIADQRHKSSVRWLFDAYEWLHNRSGHHWHIVVPVQYPPTGRNLQFGDYNYDLAEQLRNSMGVSQETLPCFVFDNFIEEEKQYGVKLPLDDNDRAKLIETVADFVNSRIEALVKSGGSPSRKTLQTNNRSVSTEIQK